MNETKTANPRKLPPPLQRGEQSLEEALATRRSVREFSNMPLTDAEISQLVWAAQGITHKDGLRTAPSAGALYPLELYVVLPSGFYHYDSDKHELNHRGAEDLRRPLHRAALAQDALIEAPVVFVIAAVYHRTSAKYGARAERYVHMEVGHAAQNLLLEATAIGLAGVPIGAFDDERVGQVMNLPANESPLYLIPIGHPE